MKNYKNYKKYILAVLIGCSIALLSAQSRGTPSQIRVNVDANGYLVVSSAAQVSPISTVQFSNARLAVDASGNLLVAASSGSGFAPADATYITKTTNATLTAEQALGSLSSGMLHSTTTTGIVDSLADVAIGRFIISQGTSSTPAYAATTDIFILKDASAWDGSVGLGTATPNLAANASANRTLTIFNATRATVEIANSINTDGGTIGNLIASDSNQSTTDKRIAEIRFLQSGTTSNNRGSEIQITTRADNASAINANTSIDIGPTGNLGLNAAFTATASVTIANPNSSTNALTLSSTNSVLRWSGSGGVLSMSGGGRWLGSGELSMEATSANSVIKTVTSGSVVLTPVTSLIFNGSVTPAATGVRFVCISTAGVIQSQAAACVGT